MPDKKFSKGVPELLIIQVDHIGHQLLLHNTFGMTSENQTSDENLHRTAVTNTTLN